MPMPLAPLVKHRRNLVALWNSIAPNPKPLLSNLFFILLYGSSSCFANFFYDFVDHRAVFQLITLALSLTSCMYV